MASPNAILQLKIALRYIEPPIWRRIEIPGSATFWELHVAIQDAMGWEDEHMHEFRVARGRKPVVRIGIVEDDWGDPVESGWTKTLDSVFTQRRAKATYVYDFGDDWEHTIELEARGPARPGVKYPVCLDGARRCPPENCGGRNGYWSLMDILADPKHKEYEERLEWLGGHLDPEAFDPAKVRFSDPRKRATGWR